MTKREKRTDYLLVERLVKVVSTEWFGGPADGLTTVGIDFVVHPVGQPIGQALAITLEDNTAIELALSLLEYLKSRGRVSGLRYVVDQAPEEEEEFRNPWMEEE